jgi:CheY-like chemotaxis protein
MTSHTNSGKKPILIVEDLAANRELFSLQIQQFGLASQSARNGREAIELLEADPDAFSMILMDLQMPVMDGLTTAQLIRHSELNTGRHIVIIALTANRALESREQCLQAGMDDFVNKPVTLGKLNDLFSKWLKDS